MADQIHLTVATVVERDGHFLTVVEKDAGGALVHNQPAGHVEPGEKIADAALRETLEETGWHVELTHILSLSTYLAQSNGVTYYRVCFAAKPLRFEPDYVIDSDIEEALWLPVETLQQRSAQMRSPLVMEAIDDYLNGTHYPLELLRE